VDCLITSFVQRLKPACKLCEWTRVDYVIHGLCQPHAQRSESVRPQLCRLTGQWPWPVWKWFSRDHEQILVIKTWTVEYVISTLLITDARSLNHSFSLKMKLNFHRKKFSVTGYSFSTIVSKIKWHEYKTCITFYQTVKFQIHKFYTLCEIEQFDTIWTSAVPQKRCKVI